MMGRPRIPTDLREIHQDLSHLVTALTATDVDNDIAVGELGHTLGNHSLATSESARNANGTSLHTGEKSIQYSLADDEGRIRRLPITDRTRHTDGPGLHHTKLGLLALELNFQKLFLHRVATLGGDAGNSTPSAGRQEDFVVVDQAVLEDGTPNVSTRDMIADLEVDGLEVPLLLAIESIDPNTTGDVDTLGLVGDSSEGSLNAVIDGLHQTRTELHGKWLASPGDRITDSQSIYERKHQL